MKREACDRYLRQATRGLWGKKRLEVREELATHLEERITVHRIGGLSEAEATERALAELGAPQHVSQGMTRLYTLPTVMGSSLALLALCLVVMALWPKGMAQTVQGTYFWPSESCMRDLRRDVLWPPACLKLSSGYWVSQQQLRTALEPQGVVFSGVKSDNSNSAFGITFPEADPSFVALGAPNLTVTGKNGKRILPAPGQVSLWSFVQTIARRNAIRVSGWETPVVEIENVTLRFEPLEKLSESQAFYDAYLNEVFSDLSENFQTGFTSFDKASYRQFFVSTLVPETYALNEISIPVGGEAGDVYGIATYLDNANSGLAREWARLARTSEPVSIFLLQVSRVDERGDLTVQLPRNARAFTDSFGTGNDLVPSDSVLVRLAGGNPQTGGWYEIVSPESVRLEPR